MNAVVELTGYDKRTEWLGTAVTVPAGLVEFVRTVAGVPESDPNVLAMYPLTVEPAAAIAAKGDLPLDPARFDYCLEAIAEGQASMIQKV
jgi:hypothetical protein